MGDKYIQGAWPQGEPQEYYRSDGVLQAEHCVRVCPWSQGLSWAKRTIPRTRRRVSPCWHLLRSSHGRQTASACKLSLCSGSKLDGLLPLFYGTLNSTGSFCRPSCPKACSLWEKKHFYPLWDLSGLKRAMRKVTLASLLLTEIIMATKPLLNVIGDHQVSLMSLYATGIGEHACFIKIRYSAFSSFHFILHLTLKLSLQFFSIPLQAHFRITDYLAGLEAREIAAQTHPFVRCWRVATKGQDPWNCPVQ